jgi:Kelch motif
MLVQPCAGGFFSSTGSLVTARYIHIATLLPNGQVLVAGGFDGSLLASAELYDPTSGIWTATDSLATARDGHTATLLPSGKVLRCRRW